LRAKPAPASTGWRRTFTPSPIWPINPFARRDAREWLGNESDASALSGTLYLDRVDLLASSGQGLLLNLIKMLQNDYAPPPRFLLLVSSHATLRQLAGQGGFLPDLAFRLTAVRFSIPPLREHREDIAPIARPSSTAYAPLYQQPTAVLAPGTLSRLLQHGWPGNLRELASVPESAILDSTFGVLRPNDLAPHLPREAAQQALPILPRRQSNYPTTSPSTQPLRRHIQLALDLNRGNKLPAAGQLGISRSTLDRLLSGASIAPETTLPC
jgi:DNA-binding NtrC family response regulator